jgi:hypothetical protein
MGLDPNQQLDYTVAAGDHQAAVELARQGVRWPE